MRPLSRRRALAALGAGFVVTGGPRIVSLDYGLAQTALAVGGTVVGMPDPANYRRWVIEPALPDEVRDVGQRTQPNMEAIRALRPDLILAVPDHDPIRTLLQAIAPVLTLPIATAARQPWAQSAAAARSIADRLGRPGAAETLIDAVTARYAAGRRDLAGSDQAALLLASFLDPRHLSVYGPGSILQDGLDRLGLRNAWTGPVGRWGSAVVPLEGAAGLEGAALFVIEPLPPDLDGVLGRSPLWRSMPFVRAGRVYRLPPVLMFGTLPAADRFASVLLPHLLAGAGRG